jgi:hypothetical protein
MQVDLSGAHCGARVRNEKNGGLTLFVGPNSPARQRKRRRGRLFPALFRGYRNQELSRERRNSGGVQRIAGRCDSRTTKLYDRRGQKLLLEDMERILTNKPYMRIS